jgi:hypothetical protein
MFELKHATVWRFENPVDFTIFGAQAVAAFAILMVRNSEHHSLPH